jgi:hypothetical protein
MKGEHKPGYRAPRTGEKRKVRQPLKIDKLSQAVRDAILKARADGATWEETAELATKANAGGLMLPPSQVHRWYDLRVEQVHREVLAQAERAQVVAAAFVGKTFEDLPESAVNALGSEVFAITGAETPAEREKGLSNLVFLLSGMIKAQAAKKRVELESEKIELAKKKFDELKEKADKATHDAAKKLGNGRGLTIDDINRIRERTFGLPPVQRSAAAGPPA